ncbi:hypothetical protein CLV69_11740 [Amycolatopsis arida]|nr:hypothetical protein CLV69_11740 [Amycolatopsis arida]
MDTIRTERFPDAVTADVEVYSDATMVLDTPDGGGAL